MQGYLYELNWYMLYIKNDECLSYIKPCSQFTLECLTKQEQKQGK